jgi:SH3-like domain-containing protein
MIPLYQMDGTRQSIGRATHDRPPGLSNRRRGRPALRSEFPDHPERITIAASPIAAHLPRRFPGGLTSAVVIAVLHAAVVTMTPRPAAAAGDQSEGSGLPLPRFASLKSDHVNVRSGPNKDQDVAWVYTRPALPVEITAEFENWRRVRDRDGSEGWVYHTLLSGKRTAWVARPKTQADLVPLHVAADQTSPLRAMLEPGVLGTVKRCNGQWCHFIGEGFDGWIEQNRLWGVYPNERIE